MRLAWLLPDTSQEVLFDGWNKPPYRPRHGKPPLVTRAARTAGGAIGLARERYLGASEEDGFPRATRPAS